MRTIDFGISKNTLFLFFLAGIFLTISNQLRFFNLPIGVGELMTLLAGLIFLLNNKKLSILSDIKNNILLIFWIVYFVLLLLGYFVSSYFGLTSNLKNVIHDLFAYIFIVFVLFTVIQFYKFLGKEKFLFYFERIVYFSIIFYSLVFVVSLSFPEFGFNFRYPILERSIGLSNNPNQPALYFSVIPLIWIYFAVKYKFYSINFNILFFILIILITYTFKSDAVFVSFVSATLIFLSIYLFFKLGIYFKIFITSLILFSIIVCVLNFNSIAYTLDGEAYHGRLELIINAFHHFDKIWYFGFGPGPHSFQSYDNNLWEVHNNFIDVFTQVGLIGMLIFIYINYYIAKGLFKNKEYILFIGFISLIVFSNFHFTFRQPIFWFFMFFFYIMSQGEKKCVE